MESVLDEEIKAAINDGSDQAIRAMYLKVFGKPVKKDCNGCINTAIEKLIKYYRNNGMNTSSKYRFSKEFKDKVFNVTVGGTTVRVTAENLCVATAEAIMNNPRLKKGIIELNPDYKPAEKKSVEVKQEKSEPISSTSTEVRPGVILSKPSVEEKDLPTKESKPLTEKTNKSGKKSAKSK